VNITLIPAPNGIGHVMRMLTLARILSEFNHKIELIIPSYSAAYFKSEIVNNLILIVIVPWEKNKIELYDDMSSYANKVKTIIKYDYIISDNLLEILKFGKKTLISSNFFWEDQGIKEEKNFSKNIIKIIKDKNVPIVTNRYFKSKSISKLNKTKQIGFFTTNLIEPQNKTGRNLLLSIGASGWVSPKEMSEITTQLTKKLISNYNMIYLDPRLFSFVDDTILDNKKFQIANYNDEMYSNISDAIVRPGLSTLQNLIAVGAHIFPIKCGNSKEIEENSQIIEDLRLGKVFSFSRCLSDVCQHNLKPYSSADFFSAKKEVEDVFTDQKNFFVLQ